MGRKQIGEGILPVIDRSAARAFEDAFVVLIDFGENEFRNYVANRPPQEQQLIFDVFTLFGGVIKEKFEEDIQQQSA